MASPVGLEERPVANGIKHLLFGAQRQPTTECGLGLLGGVPGLIDIFDASAGHEHNFAAVRCDAIRKLGSVQVEHELHIRVSESFYDRTMEEHATEWTDAEPKESIRRIESFPRAGFRH